MSQKYSFFLKKAIVLFNFIRIIARYNRKYFILRFITPEKKSHHFFKIILKIYSYTIHV